MKKLFFICLSIIVLFAFTGCSSSVDSSSGPVNTAIDTENANSPISGAEAGNANVPDISSAPGTGFDNMANRNAAYQSKQEFLDSTDGHSFQVAAYKFAKAFFEKNTKVVKSYLIDPDKGFNEYNLDYGFQNVEFMILKLNADDIKKTRFPLNMSSSRKVKIAIRICN